MVSHLPSSRLSSLTPPGALPPAVWNSGPVLPVYSSEPCQLCWGLSLPLPLSESLLLPSLCSLRLYLFSLGFG